MILLDVCIHSALCLLHLYSIFNGTLNDYAVAIIYFRENVFIYSCRLRY